MGGTRFLPSEYRRARRLRPQFAILIAHCYPRTAIQLIPKFNVFYIDGKETWRMKAGGVCRVPVYIKLSDEIGPWAGDIKKANLPDETLVDYVRV